MSALLGSDTVSRARADLERGFHAARSNRADASIFRSQAKRARLAAGVLKWLTAHLDFFDPPQEDTVLDQAPEHIMPGRARKAFGELGLALRLAHRVPELRDRDEIRRLTGAWFAMARKRNIFFDARRRVHLVPLMAVALTVFAAIDQVPEHVRRSLQAVLDRRFMDRTELGSYPKLDLKYYFDTLGLRHAFHDDAVLFAHSTLTDPPSIPHAQSMDLYGITHLIFDLSDFGARSMRAIAGSHFGGIRDYVALALATSLADRDFDLTAEFLINRLFLGVRDDELNREATDALCEAQQPAGFMPDRAWLTGLKEQDSPEARAREEFFAVYHPTLVALILLACDLSPSPEPNG